MGLLGRKFDVGFAGLGFGGLYGFGDCRAFRQRGGYLSGDGLGFCARQIANDCNHRVAGGVSLVVERLELIDGHRSDALSGAIAGVGVLLQPLEIVTPYLASGQLVTLLPEYSAPTRPMHILYAPDRRMTPKLRSFIDFVMMNFGPDV